MKGQEFQETFLRRSTIRTKYPAQTEAHQFFLLVNSSRTDPVLEFSKRLNFTDFWTPVTPELLNSCNSYL
jgi:hypothetical protein